MKICFVCGHFYEKERMSFGPYPLIYNIIKEISKKHEVFVLASGWPKRPSEEIIDGIKVYRTPSINFRIEKENIISLGLFGLPIILREKPDVINSQGFDGALLFKLLNLTGSKTKKILSVKSILKARLNKYDAKITKVKDKILITGQLNFEQMAAHNSDYFVVQSNYAKKELLELMEVNPKKLNLIYNGVNCELFKPTKNKNKQKALFFAGGTDTIRKGADLFFNSFIKLKKQFPELKAIVMGAKNAGSFKELFKKNKIPEKDITFIERVSNPELPKYINLTDLVVFPSRHETFGTVIAEAMACGKPVIGSDSSAIPEVIGNTGFLFKTNDSIDLTNKIKKLLKNSKKIKELGVKARKKACAEFNIKKTIIDYEALFKKVLK